MTPTPTAQPALPRLPSPASVFAPDPASDRVLRIIAVERALEEQYGPFHVPDAQGRLRYFSAGIDATVQRRWAARRIVELEERAAKYHTTPEYEAKVDQLPTCSCGRPLIGGRDLCPRCDVEAA